MCSMQYAVGIKCIIHAYAPIACVSISSRYYYSSTVETVLLVLEYSYYFAIVPRHIGTSTCMHTSYTCVLVLDTECVYCT